MHIVLLILLNLKNLTNLTNAHKCFYENGLKEQYPKDGLNEKNLGQHSPF